MVITIYLICSVLTFSFIILYFDLEEDWTWHDAIWSIIISLLWLPFLIFCLCYWLYFKTKKNGHKKRIRK